MADDTKLRRACDRCHNIKERCQWLPGSEICQRCSRLNHDCITARPVQKLGRKPRERPSKSSTASDGLSQTQVQRTESHGTVSSFAASSSDPSDKTHASPSAHPPADTRAIPEEQIKELALSDGVTEIERELLNICFHDTDAAGQWTLGPTFGKRHAEDLFYRLKNAVPQLKDAFISVACLMSSHSGDRASVLVQQICNNKAALSVSSLRALQINGREDVATALVLALTIATFGLFVADGDAAGVCAYALSDIMPFYTSPDVVFSPDEHAYLICLFYTELIDCVPHSKVPTMRYGGHGKAARHVDRYMGLSAPLMAIFYDLCELAQFLKFNRGANDPSIWQRCNDLEHSIRNWKPSKPEGFPERYDPVEIIQIFAQLKGLTQAALLMLHRLRYPYGTGDERGMSLSDSIIAENSLVLHFSDRGAAMGMDLAYLIACFEIRDMIHQQVTLDELSTHMRFSEPTRIKVRSQLQRVWQAKSLYADVHWYNLDTYLAHRNSTSAAAE